MCQPAPATSSEIAGWVVLKPGDFMIVKALMPQIVAISNCPILFSAYRLKPLVLAILT